MSDNEYDISRRKILGSIGAIGAAGALGGGATGALLWDEETFGNSTNPNLLQAGELDLKVDWAEHYVDWIGAETQVDGVRMVESADQVAADEVGLPTPDHPMLAVKATDTDGDGTPQIEEFMAATTTETSDDFDGPDDVGVANAPDLVDQPDPVITIQDVKPGDFGEVTLSYHVFGNPGFVSLCADVVGDDDHSSVEPELSAGDDPEDENDHRDGELGDLVQAAAWYDPNCDNRFSGGDVEVMLVADVSESLEDEFSGTPRGVNNDTDDGTGLEAVKAAVGDYDANDEPSLLSDLAANCGNTVEVGAVSTSEDLLHLDNRDDGDDSGHGRDDGNLNANLDIALTGATSTADRNGSGRPDYAEIKSLYGTGVDQLDFETEDPENNGTDVDGANGLDRYVAERTYTDNGDTTLVTPAGSRTGGIQKAHEALLPSGFTADSGITGIDPSGNADTPNETRKLMVVFTDGKPGALRDSTAFSLADQRSSDAMADGIEILPIVVNDSPSGDDVTFARKLATPTVDPVFATQFDGTPSSCDSDVTSAGFSCTSLVTAIEELQATICASAGTEQRIAGPAPISQVLGDLEECLLLDPIASGSARSPDFGGPCHQPTNTGCVALAWWLPRDIPGVNDNVVQTDSFEFTMSFNAVQCRHNVTDEGEPIDEPGSTDVDSDANG